MSTNSQRRNQDQLVAGILLLVLAASIVIVIVGDLSFWFFPAILIFLVGLSFIFISFSGVEREHMEHPFGPTQRRYRFTWGVLLSVLGVLGLLYLGGVDFAVLLAILILTIGVLTLYYWMRGERR